MEKIIKVTNPKFDFVQNFAKQNYKSEGKKKIAFLGELSGGVDKEEFIKNNEYNLHGYSGSKKRTEIVFEEFVTAIKDFRKEIAPSGSNTIPNTFKFLCFKASKLNKV